MCALLVVVVICAAEEAVDVEDDVAEDASISPAAAVEPGLYELPVVDRKEAHLFEPFASSALSDGRVK